MRGVPGLSRASRMRAPPRGRNRWPLAVLVPFLAMSPSVALAYRPFFSTDAAVANAGEVEVEVGYAAFRQNGNGTTIVAPALIANLGVARALELVGEFKLVNDLDGGDREPMRFEDSAISLKWVAREGVLQERGPAPSLAVEMSVLLPTLRGEDRPGGELVGIASARALGWTYQPERGPAGRARRRRPRCGVGRHPGARPDGFTPGGGRGERESVRGSAANNSALVGAIWVVAAPAPLHELSFDVGVRHGISRAANEWGGTAGLTFAFPVWSAGHEGWTP